VSGPVSDPDEPGTGRPTRLEPTATEATDEFWDATRREVYLVQWCSSCAEPVFFPREACPSCLRSDTLLWKQSSGRGTVHAVSVQHRAANPLMADRVPYVVALVDLDAGGRRRTVRIMSNVVNADPLAVSAGDPVTLAWEPMSDGRNLAIFEPAGDE